MKKKIAKKAVKGQKAKKIVKVARQRPYKITVAHLKAANIWHAIPNFRAEFPNGVNLTERTLKKIDRDSDFFASLDLTRIMRQSVDNKVYKMNDRDKAIDFIVEITKTPEKAFTKKFLQKVARYSKNPKLGQYDE